MSTNFNEQEQTITNHVCSAVLLGTKNYESALIVVRNRLNCDLSRAENLVNAWEEAVGLRLLR